MFQDANHFSIYIEKLALERNQNHVETLLEYCEEHQIEPDEVSHLISESLKAKLEINFQEMNYLPKVARLDL